MIVIIAGTRPELIKVAPIYLELQKRNLESQLWLTGQHESLAEAPIEFFSIKPSIQWKTLDPGQSSNILLGKLLNRIDEAISKCLPDAIIVQGDTTSALAGALAAFHRKVPIAHVEAGLRTGDLSQPFPEEMNRRTIDAFADWLFPPTEASRQSLLMEGHSKVSSPTGNTGIDALFWARDKIKKTEYWPRHVPKCDPNTRIVLSTGHRRENLGQPLYLMLRALGEEISRHPNTVLYHVVHPNPEATENAMRALSGLNRVHLIPPLDYPDFVTLLDHASVVVSDSGGVQEEAPSFAVKVLITRNVTERPEVLQCGGVLIGTDPDRLILELRQALQLHHKTAGAFQITPFGDGKASQRIIQKIISDIRHKMH